MARSAHSLFGRKKAYPKSKAGYKKKGVTRTKRRKLNQWARMNTLQSGSISSAGVGGTNLTKFQRKMLRATDPVCLNLDYSSAGSAGLGRQQAILVGWTYTYGDIADATERFFGGNGSLITDYQYNSVIQGTTAQFATNVCAISCRQESTLTNATNVPINIVLYDVQARTPQLGTRGDPVDLWTGLTAVEGGPAGSNNYSQIGNTPFTSNAFCQQYKILKVTQIQLAEGQVHKHTFVNKQKIKFNPQQLLLYQSALDVNQWSGIHKRLTTWTIAVFYGTPVSSTINPNTEVTSSNCKINWLMTQNYKYKLLPNSRKLQTSVTTMPTSLTGAGQIVQMYSGSAQAPITT